MAHRRSDDPLPAPLRTAEIGVLLAVMAPSRLGRHGRSTSASSATFRPSRSPSTAGSGRCPSPFAIVWYLGQWRGCAAGAGQAAQRRHPDAHLRPHRLQLGLLCLVDRGGPHAGIEPRLFHQSAAERGDGLSLPGRALHHAAEGGAGAGRRRGADPDHRARRISRGSASCWPPPSASTASCGRPFPSARRRASSSRPASSRCRCWRTQCWLIHAGQAHFGSSTVRHAHADRLRRDDGGGADAVCRLDPPHPLFDGGAPAVHLAVAGVPHRGLRLRRADGCVEARLLRHHLGGARHLLGLGASATSAAAARSEEPESEPSTSC